MFKSLRFVWPTYLRISKRLLSNEIKETLNLRLEPPPGANENPIQFTFVSKNLNALNLDLFVNNLTHHEDRSSDVLDLLEKLRKTKLANTVLESTHFAVFRHLVDNFAVRDVVPVLLDRPKYGIFLNNFTAFIVAQTLHEDKEYVLGLPLVLKLILAEEVDSEFVNAFCLKASLEALKRENFGDQSCDDKITKTKVQEKKVRVKFIRNEVEVDILKEIGKAFLKIENRFLKGNMNGNAKLLGFALTKKYYELEKALTTNTIEVNEDIADICEKLLLRENREDLVNEIIKLKGNNSFENYIDGLLEKASKETTKLSEEQKQLLPSWQQLRMQLKLEVENEIRNQERKDKIEATKKEIETKKELLWFFENEDKLDLEIYNKRVFYPKRWFGKKKKPRVADENYVPPEIRRIN